MASHIACSRVVSGRRIILKQNSVIDRLLAFTGRLKPVHMWMAHRISSWHHQTMRTN
jgi:hypothetical protein